MAESVKPRWSEVKKRLTKASRPRLVSILKELFDLSEQNRVFLLAKALPGGRPEVPKQYYRRVTEPFYPARGGYGKLDLADARRAIREYEKATGDPAGTIDLLLTYVESGTQFAREFGDIDARFYNSLTSALSDAIQRLRTPEGAALYPEFEQRLKDLARSAYNIGWGYGDFVTDEVTWLVDDMKPEPEAQPTHGPQDAQGR